MAVFLSTETSLYIPPIIVVGLRPVSGSVFLEAFYIQNKRFDLDTLRVANRSPTPASKINDFQGQSDDIWGARGPHFRKVCGVPRGQGRL